MRLAFMLNLKNSCKNDLFFNSGAKVDGQAPQDLSASGNTTGNPKKVVPKALRKLRVWCYHPTLARSSAMVFQMVLPMVLRFQA